MEAQLEEERRALAQEREALAATPARDLSPSKKPTTCEAEAQTPSGWMRKRRSDPLESEQDASQQEKRRRSSSEADKENNDKRLIPLMQKEAESDTRKRKHAYGGHTPAKKKFSPSEVDEEESGAEEASQNASGLGPFQLQMTPDDDRYNSPLSARSVKLSLANEPEAEGRDALDKERAKMQAREEELNFNVNMSYHNFMQLSRSQKKTKERDQATEESDFFDSSRGSSVNRTLDWSQDLNSSSISGYDADFEHVESGAEGRERRRGTRLPRASILPGATKIPEPSRKILEPSRKMPEPSRTSRTSRKAVPNSGSQRPQNRRKSLIPAALNPHVSSEKPVKSSKRAPLKTPRGELV
jgi:hypothetical protein